MRTDIPIGPRAVVLLLVLLGVVMYATGWFDAVAQGGVVGGAAPAEGFQLGFDRDDMVSGRVTGTETAEGTRRRWLGAGQQVVVRYSITRERGRVRLAVAPVAPAWNPVWTILLESSARDTVLVTAPSAGDYELMVRRTEFGGEYAVSW